MWDWSCHLYRFFELQYHAVKNFNFVWNCAVMGQSLSSFKQNLVERGSRKIIYWPNIKQKHVSKCHLVVTFNEHVLTYLTRVEIKGSWFKNHKSISWSHETKICKTSIFHKLCFRKYKFKLGQMIFICLSVYLRICLDLN